MNKFAEESWFEQEFKESLEKEYTINEFNKAKMWENIESSLGFETKKKKKNHWKGLMTTVAACMIIGFGLTSEPGHAFIDRIKEMFVPEKEVNISMEGTKEKQHIVLKESDKSDYVIYIDDSRYVVVKKDGMTTIEPKDKSTSDIPPVSMTINHIQKNVEQTMKSLEKENGLTFEETDSPIKGYRAQKQEGNEWNSEVNRYYILSDELKGAYVIHQQYFLEASEGHAVRFDNMLKEFHIVKKTESKK